MNSIKYKDVTATATLGGGCFWCIEAIFDEVKGVVSAVSGYAGGKKEAPTYNEVCGGNTGHSEVVQISFKTADISYEDLLRIFFIMHNPTSMNWKRGDESSQYSSVIFYHNEEQHQLAIKIIKELQPFFDKQIITAVSAYTKFFIAEERHQQYYKTDPTKSYCQSVINPKLNKLRVHFKKMLKKKTFSVIPVENVYQNLNSF